MQEGHRIQHGLPLRHGRHVQLVLGDAGVGSLEAGPDALWGLIRELDGRLQPRKKKTRLYLGRSATVMYTINLISVDITYCISEELAKARGLFGFGKLQQGDLFAFQASENSIRIILRPKCRITLYNK